MRTPAVSLARPIVVLVIALLLGGRADAQVSERPVAFDSAGRVTVITPPLAARLGLSAPVWPVTGDYLDARLYAIDTASSAFVLVVRRQREVLERYPIDAGRRRELAMAIERGSTLVTARGGPDVVPTFISEPVRGTFVVNQTLLGGLLFGPAAASAVGDPTGSTAAYLAVTGGAFFLAANMTQTSAVSRAQNHLSWHSARRGAIAADLTLYALTGDEAGGKGWAVATLAGGIAGDVLGFVLGEPMTDAEAHGTSHGSTVTAALAGGLMGTTGAFDNSGSRLAAALVVGAGAAGYPLGLSYVRNAPYRVTAGDVGTLVTTELLGLSAAATLLPNDNPSTELVYGVLTAGFALGALAGDQLLVRPFDHTESEARMLQYGSLAGALVALVVPVLARSDNTHVLFGATTIGGVLGAVLTEQLIAPQRARSGLGPVAPGTNDSASRSSGADFRFAPESLLLAGLGLKGNHSILSLSF